VGVSTMKDRSLIDRRTFYVHTRRDNVTRPQFDYIQPYHLSVTEGLAPVHLTTLSATSSPGSAACYYIVGQHHYQ